MYKTKTFTLLIFIFFLSLSFKYEKNDIVTSWNCYKVEGIYDTNGSSDDWEQHYREISEKERSTTNSKEKLLFIKTYMNFLGDFSERFEKYGKWKFSSDGKLYASDGFCNKFRFKVQTDVQIIKESFDWKIENNKLIISDLYIRNNEVMLEFVIEKLTKNELVLYKKFIDREVRFYFKSIRNEY